MHKTRDENRKKVNKGKLIFKLIRNTKISPKKIREAERQYYMNIFDTKKMVFLTCGESLEKLLIQIGIKVKI